LKDIFSVDKIPKPKGSKTSKTSTSGVKLKGSKRSGVKLGKSKKGASSGGSSSELTKINEREDWSDDLVKNFINEEIKDNLFIGLNTFFQIILDRENYFTTKEKPIKGEYLNSILVIIYLLDCTQKERELFLDKMLGKMVNNVFDISSIGSIKKELDGFVEKCENIDTMTIINLIEKIPNYFCTDVYKFYVRSCERGSKIILPNNDKTEELRIYANNKLNKLYNKPGSKNSDKKIKIISNYVDKSIELINQQSNSYSSPQVIHRKLATISEIDENGLNGNNTNVQNPLLKSTTQNPLLKSISQSSSNNKKHKSLFSQVRKSLRNMGNRTFKGMRQTLRRVVQP
jgi:hypothetical protein